MENKLIIPSDEIWVQQVFAPYDGEINQFLLEAKTINKDKIRNASIISTGTMLVVVYEKKVTNEGS